jgi:Dolichyl-phosphate-mannose-protein mannosyltransferase
MAIGMQSVPPRSYALFPTLFLVTLAWLALCWPWLAGNVTIPWDAKAHFQPQLSFLAASLHNGQSPFWTPNVFAGHPQIADPQSLIFAPPFLLLAALVPDPGLLAMDTVLFSCLLVGSWCIVLYFRDRGWHEAGAIVAALSFAFGGAAAWRIQHVGQVMSVAYLPIALWLLDRAMRRFSFGYGLAAGIVAGLMLLGRDQVAFLGLLMLAAYGVLRVWDSGWQLRKSIKPLLAGALGGLLVVTVPMIMTLLIAADSNRPMITLSEAGKGSLHPWSLLTALIPHLYGIARPLTDYWGPPSPDWGWVDLYLARNMATFYFGILPLVGIALLPLLLRFKTNPPEQAIADYGRRDAVFFMVSFLVLMLYSIGRYTPVFSIIFMAVPGIDKFRRPADALFVACAMGSMVGGYAIHRWIATPQFKVPKWAIVALAGVALACWVSGAMLSSTVGRLEQTLAPLAAAFCFLVASVLMLVILHRLALQKFALMAVATVFMLADLGWNNAPNESTGLNPDSYDVLRPDTRNETIALLKQKVAETRGPDRIDRVELAGLGFHWPNASLTHGLHHTLGYNPVRSAIYSSSVGARDHIAGPDQRLFTPLFPSYKSLMADLVGLRYIATGISMQALYAAAPREKLAPAQFIADDFPLVARTGDAFVYENPRALPRVLFAGNAVRADFAEMIKSGVWPEGFNPSETVILDRVLSSDEAATKRGVRSVKILSYRNTEVVIEADSTTGGFVVLNDAHDDWWRVEVNGKPAVYERANVAFRAVAVPAGKQTVRFVFSPFRGALNEVLALAGGARKK